MIEVFSTVMACQAYYEMGCARHPHKWQRAIYREVCRSICQAVTYSTDGFWYGQRTVDRTTDSGVILCTEVDLSSGMIRAYPMIDAGPDSPWHIVGSPDRCYLPELSLMYTRAMAESRSTGEYNITLSIDGGPEVPSIWR